MKLQNTLLILTIIIPGFSATGQTLWFARDTLSAVRSGSALLPDPWSGGLNAVQYSKMDLDRDGTEDLVVFDRTTSKVSTFIADPAGKRYAYRPEYELLFPSMSNWMALVDYDGDGKKELFTHIAQGVTVYRQDEDGRGGWKWVNFKGYLTTRGLSGNRVNLQVVASDIPALTDFDGDGDMDIITFEAGGDYVELNQNMSMERYGVPDSLEFVRNGECWGDFRKHTCDDFEFGIACGVVTDPGNARVMHAGNSILLHDLNGDGKKDMLLGNVECENLSIVYNGTTGIAARFSSYSPSYPAADPAALQIFPAAYLEDVDFDGVKDLLVSPNVYGNDNLMMDFISSGWHYHNAGSDEAPDFQLRQKNFLQSGMVDVGENAAVSFFDVNGDGISDMIIGNRGRFNGEDFRGSLWLFLNRGTPGSPVYELETDDYLGLSETMALTDLQPQWLDFNGDGRKDLAITAVRNRVLLMYYIPNRGAAGGPVQLDMQAIAELTVPAELSVSDRVFFYDYDKDGDPDLLVGGVLGNISFYENTGNSGSAGFVLRDSALGGIGPGFSRRFLSLAAGDLDLDGKDDIVTVDQSGKVNILYQGDWGSWTKRDSSVVLNAMTGSHSAPYLGNRLHVSISDTDGDRKPDLAVGTSAGGVYLFRNMLPVTISGNEPGAKFVVYPNPARGEFSVLSDEPAGFEVFDLLGSRIYESRVAAGIASTVPAYNWKSGVYIVRLNKAGNSITRKIVVY